MNIEKYKVGENGDVRETIFNKGSDAFQPKGSTTKQSIMEVN